MKEKEEIWKDISGYEGLYQVSDMGRVRSLPRSKTVKYIRYLEPFQRKDGYLRYNLFKNNKGTTYLAHRLVAQAFIPNTDNFSTVDHINTIKTDNRVNNLRWCTQKTNNNNPNSKEHYKAYFVKISKPVAQMTLDNKIIKIWPSAHEAERNGFSQARVWLCCQNTKGCKTHKGYKWKYFEPTLS